MNPNLRTGIFCIALATFLFVVALGLFCFALGLDFQNEGWPTPDTDRVMRWSTPSMITCSVGFVASIVFFFVGVQRVSRN